jgi:hypothetical protein
VPERALLDGARKQDVCGLCFFFVSERRSAERALIVAVAFVCKLRPVVELGGGEKNCAP